jgi:primosomal protein N' (replication factor Y)
MMLHWLSVAVPVPAHSAMTGPLTYRSDCPVAPGTLVRVPLGTREVLGIVWEAIAEPQPDWRADNIRAVLGAVGEVAPLTAAWRQLVDFAASYYQRALGEVALAALPPQLRELNADQLARRLKPRTPRTPRAAPRSRASAAAAAEATTTDSAHTTATTPPPDHVAPPLTAEQMQVLAQIEAEAGPFLLFGATGSGKTEVYLQAVARALALDPAAQALVMVPEINLTPQLEARFNARFATQYGAGAVVSLHSGMTNPQRLKSWLAAHSGAARIVLGTRMAVFASMPGLKLIVVDEEHDPSYKQQEGARYSARDLAVYRARLDGAKVLLGSATPSLESWHHSRPASADEPAGRYQRLHMPARIGEGLFPKVRRVDMNHQPSKAVFSGPLLIAIRERIARGEQAMVFLNRRGYAPVLHCADCGWKSECPHCSAFRVFHKIDRTLRCHHCGYTERVPCACPTCGNIDIAPLGRGTERLEEHLAELLADDTRPDGSPVRIARIDADTTKLKGALETQLAQVHAGEVDVLVGTQMIAKGHDFRRITLVAAINPDGALFSSDFRAPERLFALLMQAAGRAGRDAAFVNQQASAVEMWIQTFHPTHSLFEALKKHDYPAFAARELEERAAAGMPPFSFQALVRADARTQEVAQAFLNAASSAAQTELAPLPGWDTLMARITLYAAVPMSIQRVANVERAQMLIESDSRMALQRFLAAWQDVLRYTRSAPEHKGLLRWAIDVDPLLI